MIRGSNGVFPANSIRFATGNNGAMRDLMRIVMEADHDTLSSPWKKPLIRVIGRDMSDTFLHGTARKNIRLLTRRTRPGSSIKKTSEREFDVLFPPEQNEFGAELFLAEPRQPQQAHMFSQGTGNALAVVRLAPGTKVLDLSDECTRIPHFSFGGGATVLRFFHRPAITDAFMDWQANRIVPGYKERHPDWRGRLLGRMDPATRQFDIRTWQDNLVPFARDMGWGAIRFADEMLVVDRGCLFDAREAAPEEADAAATTRTFPGARQASLFTDRPTGAHEEFKAAIGRSSEDDEP